MNRILKLIALALALNQSASGSTTLLLGVDFGLNTNGTPSPVEAGYASFSVTSAGVAGPLTQSFTGLDTTLSSGTVNITLAAGTSLSGNGTILGRDRGVPTDTGSFTYGELYRDFVAPVNGGNNLTIGIAGLNPNTIYTLTFYAYDNTETNSETFSNQTLGDFGQGVSGTISWTSGYNFTGSTPNGFFSTTLIVESDPHGNLQFNDSSASGPEVVVNGIQIYAGMNGVWPVTADEISPGVLPYISVASYGAIGNGTTDDTASIQAALNAASVAGGGIVVLDALTYNIAGGPTGTNLQIPANVTLSGVWHTPSSVGISPPSAPTAGTTLLVNTPTKNPFITIGDHGTLEGVSILYPNQTTSGTPVPYPYSIQGGTVTIQNVMLWNSYNGIDLATLPSGRHIVRNVYGQPLNIGISIDQSLDIGRIKDIHFWPINSNFLSYTEASAIAIQIAQADWEIIDDLSLNGYRYGLEFNQPAHTPTDPPYGQAKNINIVDCPVGVMINDLNFYGLHISNLSYEGIRPSDCGIDYPSGPSIVGQVYINGASFYGTSLGYGVYWAGGGQISIENSYFGASSQAAFYGSAGAVALTGNTFQNAAGTTTGILISSGCQRALVTGNDYNGEQVTVNAAAASVNGNLP